MSVNGKYKLYRGVWPQSTSRLAKYGVRFLDGQWRITVLYDIGSGERFLAVEGGDHGLADKINELKRALTGQGGGAFYVNEYKHVIVPVASVGTSHYYYCDTLKDEFHFEYEGQRITSRPVGQNSVLLKPGERWIGPRPGVPYILAAGGSDIYYKTPSLTDTEPPVVKQGVERKVQLSKVRNNKAAIQRIVAPILKLKGHKGGRFYVNEHGAIFTPVDKGDGNGLDYYYCGDIDRDVWFPEPKHP
jgi:hypothetical protein